MSKPSTSTAKPYKKRTKRRNKPHPLNHRKKLGPKDR
jgi:hypothetical protein